MAFHGHNHFRYYYPAIQPELFETENEAIAQGIKQVGKYYGMKPGLPDIRDHVGSAVGFAGKVLFAIFSYYTEEGTKYYVTIL